MTYSRDALKDEIRKVLSDSFHRRARPTERLFATAYQIFNQLPEGVRAQVADAGQSGRGAGWYHSGAKVIAKMLVEMSQNNEVDVAMVDARDVTFNFEGQEVPIQPGSLYGCGLYRLVG